MIELSNNNPRIIKQGNNIYNSILQIITEISMTMLHNQT